MLVPDKILLALTTKYALTMLANKFDATLQNHSDRVQIRMRHPLHTLYIVMQMLEKI